MIINKNNKSKNYFSLEKAIILPLCASFLMLSGCNVSKADLDEYFTVQRGKPAAVRFTCNHSYGYAFRRIVQTDSLIFPQLLHSYETSGLVRK